MPANQTVNVHNVMLVDWFSCYETRQMSSTVTSAQAYWCMSCSKVIGVAAADMNRGCASCMFYGTFIFIITIF